MSENNNDQCGSCGEDGRSRERIPITNSNKCAMCGENLSEENLSRWGLFVEHEGTQMLAKVCVSCRRANELMLATAERRGFQLVAVMTLNTAKKIIEIVDNSSEENIQFDGE